MSVMCIVEISEGGLFALQPTNRYCRSAGNRITSALANRCWVKLKMLMICT